LKTEFFGNSLDEPTCDKSSTVERVIHALYILFNVMFL